MANLEEKHYISPLQLAIVVFVTCLGAQLMLGLRTLIAEAEQGAWVSVILGGFIFFAATCLMLALGKNYPDETIVEYAPRLFGRVGGSLIIFWFFLIFFLQVTTIFCGVGKVITFYMFDRTPPEVVIMALLAVCTYCALQDFGTILRIQQFMCFVAYSILMLLWITSLLNLQPENLLPLWPLPIKKIISGSFSTWSLYSGYECVLLLLPLVYRKTSLITLIKNLSGAFGWMMLLFCIFVITTIGVLTVANAKSLPYPALLVIRSVELPGTFIERLENYLLLTWIPIVFDTLAPMMFFMGQSCMRYWKHLDHRPMVLLLVPIIYAGSVVLLDDQQAYNAVNQMMNWLGIAFSFAAVPLALILSWRQKRKAGVGCDKAKSG